jgi:histidinol-phosphate phosphatase family protein
VRLLDGAPEGLLRLHRAGFRLVLVGNQSGVGRGIVTPEQACAVHERFIRELERRGVSLDAVRYCPHAPWEGCDCRKPAIGLLRSAADELGIDFSASFMIGDKLSDIQAGRNAGCRTILLGPAAPESDGADHVAGDWSEALAFILQVATAP